MPAPIPLPPPVMSATFPANENAFAPVSDESSDALDCAILQLL
jgi:hypothetical protein